MTNLAEREDVAARLTRLREELEAGLLAEGDPRMSGEGAVFEAYPYAGAEAGFYERYTGGEELDAGWVEEGDFESAAPDAPRE